MEPEVVTVLGLLIIIVVSATFLYAPTVIGSSGETIRKFYEVYIDWAVVLIGAVIALILLTVLMQKFIVSGQGKYAYLTGAAFIYLIRMGLSLLDAIDTGNTIYLLDTFAHILDVAILALALAGIMQENE